MLWQCAVRKMVGEKKYSLHLFPKIIEIQGGQNIYAKIKRVRQLWVSTAKLHRKKTLAALHLPPFCTQEILQRITSYMIEGQRYRNESGIPAQKRLKPDTLPTTFPKPSDKSNTSNNGCSSTTPQGRLCSARREQSQGVDF